MKEFKVTVEYGSIHQESKKIVINNVIAPTKIEAYKYVINTYALSDIIQLSSEEKISN